MLLNNEQVIIFPINLMRFKSFNKQRVDSLFKNDRILPSVYIMTQQAHQVGLVTKFLVHLNKAYNAIPIIIILSIYTSSRF